MGNLRRRPWNQSLTDPFSLDGAPLRLAVLDNQLREDMLLEEMTARSRGPQSPRRGHAIRWHGPAVFDNLYC